MGKKSDLCEEIENYEHELAELKSQIKQVPKHITWGELEEKDKSLRLLPGRKRLMDTVRMIAYRAETAIMGLMTGSGLSPSAARRLFQDLFVTEADILPDTENNRLTIRVHNGSRAAVDRGT